MAKPRRGKKLKKGKRKKKIPPPKPRKSFLEWEIACENAILADLRRQVADSQNRFSAVYDDVKKGKNDIEDVCEFALHEIREELEEIAMYDRLMEELEKIRNEQTAYYSSQIDEKSDEAEKIITKLSDKVYYENTNLQILKVTNREFSQYLEELDKYHNEKTKIERELEMEMYEEDKLARASVGKEKIQMEYHLKRLRQLLMGTDESPEEVREQIEKDVATLLNEVYALTTPYLKCLKSVGSSEEVLRSERISNDIDVEGLRIRSQKINKIDHRLSTLADFMFEYSPSGNTSVKTIDDNEIIEKENESQTKDTDLEDKRKTIIHTYSPCIQTLVNQLGRVKYLALAAINVEEPSFSTGWSVSIEEEELENNIELFYKKREVLLQEIYDIFENEKKIDKESSTKCLKDEEVICDKKKIKQTKHKYQSLMRPEFMKNWREPDYICLKNIKKEANLPIGGKF